jgi:WD40 repeat protein
VNQLPCFWDVATGKEVVTFGARTWRADWIALSPDGKTLACGSSRQPGRFPNDGDNRLLDIETGNVIHKFTHDKGDLTRFVFSPDKKTFASADDNGLLFFELVTGQVRQLPRAEPKKERFGTLAFSSDGKWLAAVSEGKKVAIAEAPSGKIVRRFAIAGGEDAASSALLTVDDKSLITGHKDGFTRFWDIQSGAKLREFRTHDRDVWRMALAPDGKTLATTRYGPVGSQSTVLLWDVATGKPLLPSAEPRAGIARLVVSPDSRRVALASWDGSIHMWDPTSGRQFWKADYFGPLAFTPDGETLICGGWSDGIIRFLDAETGKEKRQFGADKKGIHNMALSADGKYLAATGRTDGFQLWDAASGRVVQRFGDQKSFPLDFIFAPNNAMIVSVHDDEILRVWDTRSGKLLREHQKHSSGGLAFSPDGRILASKFRPDRETPWTIRLLDPSTGKEIRELKDIRSHVDSMAFSPDSRTLMWGGQHSNELSLCEVATGKLRRKFFGHQGQMTCVAFSPDGRWLASGNSDASVLIWDAVGERSRQNPPPELNDAALDRLWADLISNDTVIAYQAICTLRAVPKQAVKLFEKHLKPVPRIDAKKIVDALRGLESEQFAVRNQAAKDLENMGEAAEAVLRKALDRATDRRRAVAPRARVRSVGECGRCRVATAIARACERSSKCALDDGRTGSA